MIVPILFEGNKSFGFYELPNKFGHLFFEQGIDTIDFFHNGTKLITSDNNTSDPNFSTADVVVTFSGGTIVIGYITDRLFLRAGDEFKLESYTDGSKTTLDAVGSTVIRPTFTYIEISGDANNGVVRSDIGDKSAEMANPLSVSVCEELSVSGHTLFIPNISSDFDSVIYRLNGSVIQQSDIGIHNNPSTTPVVNPDGTITNNTTYGIWLNPVINTPFEISVDRNGENAIGECGLYVNGVGFRDAGGFNNGSPTTTVRPPSGIEDPVTLSYTSDSVFTIQVTSNSVNLIIDGEIERSYPLAPTITSNAGDIIPNTPQPYLSTVRFDPKIIGEGYISYKVLGNEVRQALSVTSCDVVNDSATTYQGQSVTGNVSTNDQGCLGEQSTTYEVAKGTSNGTLTLSETGVWSYTPNSGFIGEDVAEINYYCDGILSGSQTLTIIVLPLGSPTIENFDFCTKDCFYSQKITGTSTTDGDVVIFKKPLMIGAEPVAVGVSVSGVFEAYGEFDADSEYYASLITFDGSSGVATIDSNAVCETNCILSGIYNGNAGIGSGYVKLLEYPIVSSTDSSIAVGLVKDGRWEIFSEDIQEGTDYVIYAIDIQV